MSEREIRLSEPDENGRYLYVSVTVYELTGTYGNGETLTVKTTADVEVEE